MQFEILNEIILNKQRNFKMNLEYQIEGQLRMVENQLKTNAWFNRWSNARIRKKSNAN